MVFAGEILLNLECTVEDIVLRDSARGEDEIMYVESCEGI